jgi:hypothetical protein
MLAILVAPAWAAILSLMYIWGLDPSGPVMETAYVVAGITTFFSLILGEGI